MSETDLKPSAKQQARLFAGLRECDQENKRLRQALHSVLNDCRHTEDPAHYGKLRARIINRIVSDLGATA